MKAILDEEYGTPETLRFREVEKPTLKENQVLVKVHAASLNYSKLVLFTGKPRLARLAYGLTKPKFLIPGSDMAGIVEDVGKQGKVVITI